MERRHFWLLLFLIVLAYDLYLEHHFIFIYYTIQTFSLEILYFTAAVLEKAGHTRRALEKTPVRHRLCPVHRRLRRLLGSHRADAHSRAQAAQQCVYCRHPWV